jgi:hypothetical protein
MKNKGGHAYHIIKMTKITLFSIFRKNFYSAVTLVPSNDKSFRE